MSLSSRIVASSLLKMRHVVRLDAGDGLFSPAILASAKTLRKGGVVALPTDTLYGVTSLLEHSQRLFHVKRRSPLKPLGLFVAGPSEVHKWAKVTIAQELLRELLPGPVTLIFDRLPSLPSSFNPDTNKVGVRVPECSFVNELCAVLAGQPLAQTSANPSGSSIHPVRISDFADLHDEIDLVVDGGEIHPPSDEGSTIVDLSVAGSYRIVRSGCALEETTAKLQRAGLVPFDDS